jgi:uncharacterized membrane protein
MLSFAFSFRAHEELGHQHGPARAGVHHPRRATPGQPGPLARRPVIRGGWSGATGCAPEARRLAADLIIQPDAIAVISRDKDGSYHVTTSHHPMTKGASWGLFWGFLFGLLSFIPVLGMAVGAGLGALMGRFAKTSIDQQFQDQVRGLVQPGTSALFLMLEKMTTDKAVEAMSKYGGTVLKTSLSKDDEKDLQEALHGGA